MKRYLSLLIVAAVILAFVPCQEAKAIALVEDMAVVCIVGIAALLVAIGISFSAETDAKTAAEACYNDMPQDVKLSLWEQMKLVNLMTLWTVTDIVKTWVKSWAVDKFSIDTENVVPETQVTASNLTYSYVNGYKYVSVDTVQSKAGSMYDCRWVFNNDYAAFQSAKLTKVRLDNFEYTVFHNGTAYNIQRRNVSTGELYNYQNAYITTDTMHRFVWFVLVYGQQEQAWTIYAVKENTLDNSWGSTCNYNSNNYWFYNFGWNPQLNTYVDAVGASSTATVKPEVAFPPIPGSQVLRVPAVSDVVGKVSTDMTTGAAAGYSSLDLTVNPDLGIDFTPIMSIPEITITKFPFSIPWDIKNLFFLFIAEAKTPHFTLPFCIPGIFDEPIDVDLTPFNPVALILQAFIYLLFLLGLMKFTPRFFGGV